MSSLVFPTQATPYAIGRTIYVLDDCADFCATAKWWLIGLGYHVHDFQDAEPALQALASLDAPARERACLLLDVRMPVMSGLQVHDILIERQISGPLARPSLPVIYMTGHGDVPLAVQAMEKGAVTFLEKPFQENALEAALSRAFNRTSLSPAASVSVSAPEPAPCPEFERRLASLTPREAEVMQNVLEGQTSKLIARKLNISIKTIEQHRSHIMSKMQATSVVHLTRMVLARRAL